MPVDDDWIQQWIGRMDRGSRFEAITELRLAKEKEVVNLNRELGDRLGEFHKLVMEIYAFMAAAEPPDDLEQRVDTAKKAERELREFEEMVDRSRKEFEAFASMEREINRMA